MRLNSVTPTSAALRARGMFARRPVVLLLVASLLASLCAVVPTASRTVLGNGGGAGPRTWYVGPGGGSAPCDGASLDFTTGVAGDGSEWGAIQAAVDAATTGDTIFLCDNVYDLTTGIDLSGPPATSVTFRGESTAGTIVDGGQAVQLFYAGDEGDVAFVGLTLRNGSVNGIAPYSGGAVYARDVAVHGAVFRDNSAQSNGGAIEASGSVTITDGTFIGNIAGGSGGAVDANTGFSARGGTFRSNLSSGSAGAVYVSLDADLADVLFEDNTAGDTVDNYGGAISARSVTLVRGEFRRNTAGGDGGAIYAYQGASISDGTFEDNEGNSGGAVSSDAGVSVTDGLFVGNIAAGNGGAIEAGQLESVTSIYRDNSCGTGGTNQAGGAIIVGDRLTSIHDEFTGNFAPNTGGAIRAFGNVPGRVAITDGTFRDNTAYTGGAVSTGYSIVVEVTRGEFTRNVADLAGGAINAQDATLTIDGADFSSNTAGSAGGAVATGGNVIVTGGTFTANVAVDGGGGISASGLATITGTAFIGNLATVGFGGGVNATNADLTEAGFAENSAGISGGALAVARGGTVSDGTFADNRAGLAGGAIFAGGLVNGTFTATSSIFRGNLAISGTGGAIRGGEVGGTDVPIYAVNSTFLENTAATTGGAIATGYGSLDGNTFVRNDAASSGQVDILNIYAKHSLFVGGTCAMSQVDPYGNLTTDDTCPGAVVPEAALKLGGLVKRTMPLDKGSVAIDPTSGIGYECSLTTDGRGAPRPALARCDAGAYEYQGAVDLTTGIAVSATVNGTPLTPNQRLLQGTVVTVSAAVTIAAGGADTDLTAGQVLFVYCQDAATPAACGSDGVPFATVSVTEGSTADGVGEAQAEYVVGARGHYRLGAIFGIAGGVVGGSDVTTGTPTFFRPAGVAFRFDATAGSAVLPAGTTSARVSMVLSAFDSPLLACPVWFSTDSTTVTATLDTFNARVSATIPGLVPGANLVTITTGDTCASQSPAWAVVTVKARADTWPKGTVGAVGGGAHYFGDLAGPVATLGFAVDATTQTVTKGKTGTVRTTTNISLTWIRPTGAGAFKLTAATTGDVTTGSASSAPWQRATCPELRNNNNALVSSKGVVCGALTFRGRLSSWSSGDSAWTDEQDVRFTLTLGDGGSTRRGDLLDWASITSMSPDPANVAPRLRPLGGIGINGFLGTLRIY